MVSCDCSSLVLYQCITHNAYVPSKTNTYKELEEIISGNDECTLCTINESPEK